MKKNIPLLSVLCLIGFVVMTTVQSVHGFPDGIVGFSGQNGTYCNVCHNTGVVPEVSIAGPSVVEPGNAYLYTLMIAGGQEVAGGLDVSVTNGVLAAISADTQLLSDEITHTDPKAANPDGTVTFTFQWTAPITATAVTMYGAGNSVDLLNGNQGDAADVTTLAISVMELNEKVYLPVVMKP